MAHRRTRHSILHTAVASATARLKGLRYRKVGLVPALLVGGGALLLYSAVKKPATQRRSVAGLEGLDAFPPIPTHRSGGFQYRPTPPYLLTVARPDYWIPDQLTPWDRGAEIRALIRSRLPVNQVLIDPTRNRI